MIITYWHKRGGYTSVCSDCARDAAEDLGSKVTLEQCEYRRMGYVFLPHKGDCDYCGICDYCVSEGMWCGACAGGGLRGR